VNPSTAFGMVLADELARCGLREVVIAPGSRSTPLAIAFWELERTGRARLHVRIDERSASFTALGLAKVSRRPVAVVCTSGTAAANFHPAVIEADESAVPLLLLTADRPPELRGTGASQTVDQVKLYGSAVRWYAEAGVPERRSGAVAYWRSLACRAWARAAGAAGALPGPVHLNLPLRDPLVPDSAADSHADSMAVNDWPEPLGGRPGGHPWTLVADGTPTAEPLELPWTERGVVVCGDGDYDAAALTELAERAGWPVLAEPSSAARRGPNAMVGYHYLLASADFMAAHRPQVVISAGRPGLSRPQSALLGLASAAPDTAGGSEDPGATGSTATYSTATYWGAAEAGDGGPGPGTRGGVTGGAATGGAGTGGAGTGGRQLAMRHVVIAQGPGRWADSQRAATDVAAAVRVSGLPPALPGRWLASWQAADAAATSAAARILDARPAGAAPLPDPESARPVPAPPTGQASTEPARSWPARSGPATSGPARSEPATSGPATSEPATSESAMPRPAAEAVGHGTPVAGLNEPGVARELAAALPENALLWCGNSLSVRDIDLFLPARADVRVIASRGASGIDGTASTAIGAALAHARQHPGAAGFALIGDLSLLHDAPGLALGPDEARPDLLLVVVNNDGGGIFAGLEPARFPGPFERVFATPHGASIGALAAAFGIPYELAEQAGDIAKAVAGTVPGSGLRIVEARTGLAANARLREAMRAAAVTALAALAAGEAGA
jgi:2-succinyl-5-enolpyruvyl-6-hydroxy-3-cyclohexene-1-carboxylate synthase